MQAELDHQFMGQALDQAKLAALAGEVPVGAVLVRAGMVIAKAFNQPIGTHDPSASEQGRGEGVARSEGDEVVITH